MHVRMDGRAAAEYDSLNIDCSRLLMDRYSPRRSLYSGPNSFVDSDEVSPEIGLLQNAESFYGSAGRSSSRICHISMLHMMEYNVACVLIFNRNE